MTLSTKSNRQLEYQTQILSELGVHPSLYSTFTKIWWRNPINPNSLRLTRNGVEWLTKNANVKFYKIDLDKAIVSKHLLQLEKLIQAPYYLPHVRKLYVTDEATAIMLQLHAGNLGQYLENLQLNQ